MVNFGSGGEGRESIGIYGPFGFYLWQIKISVAYRLIYGMFTYV